MPTDRNFVVRLEAEGHLTVPVRHGFPDVESEDHGHAVAWSRDGRAGIAFTLRHDGQIDVHAVDRAGLPLTSKPFDTSEIRAATRVANSAQHASAKAEAEAVPVGLAGEVKVVAFNEGPDGEDRDGDPFHANAFAFTLSVSGRELDVHGFIDRDLEFRFIDDDRQAIRSVVGAIVQADDETSWRPEEMADMESIGQTVLSQYHDLSGTARARKAA